MSGKAKQDGRDDRPHDDLFAMATAFDFEPHRCIDESAFSEAPGASGRSTPRARA